MCISSTFPVGPSSLMPPPDLPLLFSQPLPRAPSPPHTAWVLLLCWFGNVSPDTSQGAWEIPLICLLSACSPKSGKSISFTSCFSVIHREKVNLLPHGMKWESHIWFCPLEIKSQEYITNYSSSVAYKNLFTFAIIY